MNWDNFKSSFHESWHDVIKPFVESEACDEIYAYLKKEGRRGKKIAPLSSATFRCFHETEFDKMRVIIVGMSPYHTFKKGAPVADGLLLSCSVTNSLQPSLDQFYDGIIRELYNDCEIIKDPDLTYLANQGVLLFNSSLTTEMNKAGSHMTIWEPFTRYMFEHVFDGTGIPVVFLGKEAAKFERYVTPFTWKFSISHPASAAYKHTEWDSEGVFTNINKILSDNKKPEINWAKIKL